MAPRTTPGTPRRPDPNRAARMEARTQRQAATGGEPVSRPGENPAFARTGRLSQQQLQASKEGILRRAGEQAWTEARPGLERSVESGQITPEEFQAAEPRIRRTGGEKAWQATKDFWQGRLQEGGSEPLRAASTPADVGKPLSASNPFSPTPAKADVLTAGGRAGRLEARATSLAAGRGEPWTPRQAYPGVYETTGAGNQAARVIGTEDSPERFTGEQIQARQQARAFVPDKSMAEGLRDPKARASMFPEAGTEETAATMRGQRIAAGAPPEAPTSSIRGGFKALAGAVKNMSPEEWAGLGKGLARGAVRSITTGAIENRIIGASLRNEAGVPETPNVARAREGARQIWENSDAMQYPFREAFGAARARIQDVIQRRNPNEPGSQTFKRKIEKGEAAFGGPRTRGPRTLVERDGQGGNRA